MIKNENFQNENPKSNFRVGFVVFHGSKLMRPTFGLFIWRVRQKRSITAQPKTQIKAHYFKKFLEIHGEKSLSKNLKPKKKELREQTTQIFYDYERNRRENKATTAAT